MKKIFTALGEIAANSMGETLCHEHAFVVKKGEKLRIDISSSAFPFYVRHTDNKGLFSEQTTTKIANNTIVLDKSYLNIFCE